MFCCFVFCGWFGYFFTVFGNKNMLAYEYTTISYQQKYSFWRVACFSVMELCVTQGTILSCSNGKISFLMCWKCVFLLNLGGPSLFRTGFYYSCGGSMYDTVWYLLSPMANAFRKTKTYLAYVDCVQHVYKPTYRCFQNNKNSIVYTCLAPESMYFKIS